MSQFVVYYPRFWSGLTAQTPAPSGSYTAPLSPTIGPGEQWQVINEYVDLSDAYTAADGASGTYLAQIYDRDNQAKLYGNSPTPAALAAAGKLTDNILLSLTTKKDSSAYLRWERRQIDKEAQAQIVATKDPKSGGPISPLDNPVTAGFFASPMDMPSWLAILRAATIRTRTSGQTGASSAAEWAAYFGDSSQAPAYRTSWS